MGAWFFCVVSQQFFGYALQHKIKTLFDVTSWKCREILGWCMRVDPRVNSLFVILSQKSKVAGIGYLLPNQWRKSRLLYLTLFSIGHLKLCPVNLHLIGRLFIRDATREEREMTLTLRPRWEEGKVKKDENKAKNKLELLSNFEKCCLLFQSKERML